MQNECLGYLIKSVNDLEDLEMLMEEEINSLKENVDNLEESLVNLVGELLIEDIAAMTGVPLSGMTFPGMTMQAIEDQLIPSPPPLPAFFQPGAGQEMIQNEPIQQALEEAMNETEGMEESLQSQMLELMQQVKSLMSSQREAPAAKPIPAPIQSEVEQAATRMSEIQAPEKEGLAYMKGVLKWKPCKVIVKDNRLLVFKAGRIAPSEDIYLSEAIKLSQETARDGYYGLRLTLSLTDSVILGWTDEYLMKDWFAYLSAKIRPILTRTEFVMSGQKVVPQSTIQYQRVPMAPSVSPIPTGAQFLEAIQGGDIPTVRNMFEKGADPLACNTWGGNWYVRS